MDETLWEECIQFHGHSCPGLASGYRVAEFAMAQLGIALNRAHDEELVCIAENETCGVDGIQYLLGCTLGKGNLIIKPLGKMAYSFYDRKSGKSVRVLMKPFDRSADRTETMNMILQSPAEMLFEVKKTEGEVPEKARIFESVQCVVCGEFCREDKIRLQNGEMRCLSCFDSYDRG